MNSQLLQATTTTMEEVKRLYTGFHDRNRHNIYTGDRVRTASGLIGEARKRGSAFYIKITDKWFLDLRAEVEKGGLEVITPSDEQK